MWKFNEKPGQVLDIMVKFTKEWLQHKKPEIKKKLLATSYRLSNLGQCRSKKDHWSCEHEGSYVSISTLAEANILNFWEVTLVCIEKIMESLFHTSDRYLTNFGAKRIIKVPYFSRLKADSHIKLHKMKSENDFKIS